MNEEEQTTPNTNNENQAPETPAVNTPPAGAPDDQLFQSAGNDMNMPDEHQQTPAPVMPPKKGKKKPIFLIILLVLLLVGGAVFYYFYSQDSTPQPAETTQVETPAVAELTYEPNTVAYAFQASATDPVATYTRPAIGGERTEVEKFTRDTVMSYSDVYGSNVAFVTDNDIYVSTDHGETYKKVFDGDNGSQITSLMFNEAGDKLGFGYLKKVGGSNTVTSISLSGEDKTNVFTTKKAGVILLAWNDKTALYQEGCYNCGGGDFPVISRDLSDNKAITLLEDVEPQLITAIAAASDTSQLVYVVGTEKTSGGSLTPITPYTVSTLDPATGESTEITTVGKAGEKNPNGTDKTYMIKAGYSTGSNTPFYTADNELYLVQNNEALLFFEADKTILGVDYVSDQTVISRTGDDTSDYLMSNYSVEAKKTTKILQGDNNTTIFGVTTD